MKRLVLVALVLGGLTAGAGRADAPSKSLRPLPRPAAVLPVAPPDLAEPAVVAAQEPAAQGPMLLMTKRPKMRPSDLVAVSPTGSDEQVVKATASGVVPAEKRGLFSLLRPAKRPPGLNDKTLAAAPVAPVKPGKQGVVSQKGSVCGDPSIKGETLAPITARIKECGVSEPVKITSVAGVRLSQAATMDCPTARALKTWVERGVEPAYGKGKVVELKVAGHYICRTRNHRAGAKISEHGRGRAIDISGFTFSNGKTVMVQGNFDKTMRKAHKAACGIFGTTLGPGSDGMHEDHLHFDTARHRNGPYCR